MSIFVIVAYPISISCSFETGLSLVTFLLLLESIPGWDLRDDLYLANQSSEASRLQLLVDRQAHKLIRLHFVGSFRLELNSLRYRPRETGSHFDIRWNLGVKPTWKGCAEQWQVPCFGGIAPAPTSSQNKTSFASRLFSCISQ